MNKYMRLNDAPDLEGKVDFIANKTKRNYVNLNGANSNDVIDCVHAFLCDWHLWDITDEVIYTKKPKSFVPDPTLFHDISPILGFYNNTIKEKEILLQILSTVCKKDATNLLDIPANNRIKSLPKLTDKSSYDVLQICKCYITISFILKIHAITKCQKNMINPIL